ncbi:MAG: hypothetical protein P1P78_13320 [Methyloprofundus sp.]|nr:hypothetical protein [Methyloprofundus sp.]
MGLSLLMVPFLLKILGVSGYGTWAALSSLIIWLTLFDFGMGHALKNTVSKSIAHQTPADAHDELFQVLKITIVSAFLLMVIFLVALQYFDLLRDNYLVSLALFIPVIVFFPLKIANFILQGARLIALDAGLMFLNTLIFFLIVAVLYFFDFEPSLMFVALSFIFAYTISLVLVSFKAMLVLGLSYKDFSKILRVKFDLLRIKLSLKFFGLQLSSLVLYSLGTVIIFTYLSSEHAAQYDVINKIFIFGLSFFTIIVGSFWPEISTHLVNNKLDKVRSLYLKMLLLSLVFSFFAFVVAYFAPTIVQIWTESQIEISRDQALFFALLVSFQAIAYSGAVVLNALEKINIQLGLSILATALMLPFAIYLIDMGYSIEAVPLASAILTFAAMIYCNTHAFILIRKV